MSHIGIAIKHCKTALCREGEESNYFNYSCTQQSAEKYFVILFNYYYVSVFTYAEADRTTYLSVPTLAQFYQATEIIIDNLEN